MVGAERGETLKIYQVSEGRYREIADSWAAEVGIPGAKAYQVEGGGNSGTIGRDVDGEGVAAMLLGPHLAKAVESLPMEVQTEPGLIVLDAEPHNVWWHMARDGVIPEGFDLILAAWAREIGLAVAGRQWRSEGWGIGVYAWPPRPRGQMRLGSIVLASEQMGTLWRNVSAILPQVYWRENSWASGIHLTLAHAAEIAAEYGLEVYPQISPFIAGRIERGPVPLEQWNRDLEAIAASRRPDGSPAADGLAIWCDATGEAQARAMRDAMNGPKGEAIARIMGV